MRPNIEGQKFFPAFYPAVPRIQFSFSLNKTGDIPIASGINRKKD
jgi:hypothetical protein